MVRDIVKVGFRVSMVIVFPGMTRVGGESKVRPWKFSLIEGVLPESR